LNSSSRQVDQAQEMSILADAEEAVRVVKRLKTSLQCQQQALSRDYNLILAADAIIKRRASDEGDWTTLDRIFSDLLFDLNPVSNVIGTHRPHAVNSEPVAVAESMILLDQDTVPGVPEHGNPVENTEVEESGQGLASPRPATLQGDTMATVRETQDALAGCVPRAHGDDAQWQVDLTGCMNRTRVGTISPTVPFL
jgi:hypothetical protein